MKSLIYGCKDKPKARVQIFVDDIAELPAQITIRYPNEGFKEYTFRWHYNPEPENDYANGHTYDRT